MAQNPEKAGDVLAQIEQLLDVGKPEEALHLIRRFGTGSAVLKNAYGVALMRSGEWAKAVEVYRGLCLSESGITLKSELPTVMKVNYATALLLAGNAAGCLDLLREIGDDQDASAKRLRAAIVRWKRSLGLLARLALSLYGREPKRPVELDFRPGELLIERDVLPEA